MLTMFNDYLILVVLGILLLFTIPYYIFIHSVKNTDRLNVRKKKKIIEELNKSNKHGGSDGRIEEQTEEEMKELSNEYIEITNSPQDTFQEMTDEGLRSYYRTLRIQLPNVDELVRRQLLTREQGQEYRNKMKTIILILKERSESSSQENEQTTR
ncbi:hypothetical protein POF51_25930 [Brevibacillus sp. AG]|uniref:hypothetical protein n=1 Tax=Brevibacillus sp. AG TaxID=3020891 RepID=UPI00232FAC0F|nr:hypothetical protein [Brevibacillus sp. AG]MDC0764163.1 hypothetical protein [Brevibacillus sp. AG]